MKKIGKMSITNHWSFHHMTRLPLFCCCLAFQP